MATTSYGIGDTPRTYIQACDTADSGHLQPVGFQAKVRRKRTWIAEKGTHSIDQRRLHKQILTPINSIQSGLFSRESHSQRRRALNMGSPRAPAKDLAASPRPIFVDNRLFIRRTFDKLPAGRRGDLGRDGEFVAAFMALC